MSVSASYTSRTDLLSKFERKEALQWDVIVVGGGITGAGVLREAARRGYKALLLEQQDFAWGTSSRSSKMVHGGLRYLASGDFKLSKHSLLERERILREAPGLSERMGYYYVLRKGKFPGRLAMSLVLWIYDHIAGIKDHRYVNPESLLKVFPGLQKDRLQGASYYTDAVTDDSRLVMRVLQEAMVDGGCALNYARVNKLLFDGENAAGVIMDAEELGRSFELRASVVINATGAWADRLRGELGMDKRVRPLRGSHLVLARECCPIDHVLALQHPEDGRAVFVFPWEGTTVIGTTDLDHSGNLDTEASISDEEVSYLLAIISDQFPGSKVSRANVISSWSGVRPVIGADKAVDASKERRDHAVWSDNGLITVSGGKLTTFRLIALDVLRAAEQFLPKKNTTVANDDRVFRNQVDQTRNSESAHVEKIRARFGESAEYIISNSEATELECIAGTTFSLAECRYAIKHEAVLHLDDLMLRRTRLGQVLPDGGDSVLGDVQELFVNLLGWDEPQWQQEVHRYKRIWQRYYSLPGSRHD
ncbi:MAG: glycerol-3-phosphate dehydrogenase/oxidase [Pseudomonadota bacterium]